MSSDIRQPLLCEAPLAPEQMGMWYLQQAAPECGAYHLLFSVELCLTDAALPERASALLRLLLQEQVILRTAFHVGEDGPVQRVHSAVVPDVRVSDAPGWSDERLREQARQDSRQPFDLCRPPLWRVHLYRRQPGRWLLVVVFHHALLDFWSIGLLLREFAGRLGMAAPLEQRLDGHSFGEHARRRQAQLNDPQKRAAWLAYWHHQLEGAPAVHSLPLDAPRGASTCHEGSSLAFAFDAQTSDAVRQVAREQGATPFMVLLAAYALLLHRFSGEDDVVLATPLAGRSSRAQRHQLGQFVNSVPLRLRLGDSAGFKEWLQHVKQVVVDGLRHGDCPFHWLVEALAPVRDPAHAPLAQLAFAWERLPMVADFEPYFVAVPADAAPAQPMRGAELRPFPVPQQEGQFELLLEMGGEVDGAFVGVFKYQPQLFSRASIETLAESFVHLSARLLRAPRQPLASLGLDGTLAAARCVSRGRGPSRHWPPQEGVLERIQTVVRQTPAAIALRDAQAVLSYAELWRRAESVAAALAAVGAGPGRRVGLMLERHVDLVCGLLGIWMNGAAHVPLDPEFPSERLAYMAADARLCAVFSEAACRSLWPAGAPVVSRETVSDAAFPAALAGDTAYVIYTSGSTGRPKGVQVGHAALRNFLLGMQDLLQWNANTRLLAVTTPAFDISALELLLPLMVGGEVQLADAATSRDGLRLAQALAALSQSGPITALQATPATWQMLIDVGWAGSPSLTALCGGEALSPALAARLQDRCAALWNLYGPTETTVWSTAARLQPGESVHLGQPLANTQLHVLDEAGRPLPPGPWGELWIGGDGLAQGYWRQPVLTADRFRGVPALPTAARLYRTGDRVRWNAAGQLEHQGRLDSQVKLRGFRIELGEIESLLCERADVQAAVAMVREDRPGDARLVLYWVAADGLPQARPEQLRDSLRERLPAYMLPSAFIRLERLPQTPNRKIDRKALPVPSAVREGEVPTPSAPKPPRDALEIQLASLFCELLQVPCVDLDDSFFDLGGHSLLAVRLVAEVRQRCQLELAVADLVQQPSVAALARHLRRQQAGGAPDLRVVLREVGGSQPLWLFHPIGGSVFCYLELTRQLAPGRSVLALQSPGLDQAGEAEVSMEAMARRYLPLLRERQPQGPYLLGGWCFGGNLAFEMARQLAAAGESVDGIVLIDTRAPVPANVPADADDATLLSWFARDLAAPYGLRLDLSPQSLRDLPAEAMFDQVLLQAKQVGALPEDADADQLARFFEVYLANGMAVQSYFPPAGNWPLLLLCARDEAQQHGPRLGWEPLAAAGLQAHALPGDHNSIVQAPHAQAVAACIDSRFPPKSLEPSAT